MACGADEKIEENKDDVNGEFLKSLTGHTLRVESVAYSPAGKTIASGSDDDTTRLWACCP